MVDTLLSQTFFGILVSLEQFNPTVVEAEMGLSEFRDTFIAQNQIKSRFLVLVARNRHYLKYSQLLKGMNKKMKLIIDFVTLSFLTSLLHWHQISMYYKVVTKYNQCSSPCSYPFCYATLLHSTWKVQKGFDDQKNFNTVH